MSLEHQLHLTDDQGSQPYSLDAAAPNPPTSPAPFALSFDDQQGVMAAAIEVQSFGTGSQDVSDQRETPPSTPTRLLLRRRRKWWRRAHWGYWLSVAFVVCQIVSFFVAAVTTWMALRSAQEAGRSPCNLDSVHFRLAPDDQRSLTIIRPGGDGFCMIDAALLLSRASQLSLAYVKLRLANVLPSTSIYGAGKGVAQFRPSILLELTASVGEQSHAYEARRCTAATEGTMWTAHSSGHLRGDLSVKAGRISIKSTGYYHMYSQISSDDRSCRSATGLTLGQLRHSILRDNPSLAVVADVLLAVEAWRCTVGSRGQQSGNGGISLRKPIYLGATFLLLRGDEVYVMVSCIDDLKFNAAETYFGMHMI